MSSWSIFLLSLKLPSISFLGCDEVGQTNRSITFLTRLPHSSSPHTPIPMWPLPSKSDEIILLLKTCPWISNLCIHTPWLGVPRPPWLEPTDLSRSMYHGSPLPLPPHTHLHPYTVTKPKCCQHSMVLHICMKQHMSLLLATCILTLPPLPPPTSFMKLLLIF